MSLRPVGQHRRLLRVAEALGAKGLSLPGLRLAAREDTPTRAALDTALQCSNVIFTSPSAVRFAIRLRTLAQAAKRPNSRLCSEQRVLALGTATGKALRRAGFANVGVPSRASSEHLLALPELLSVSGHRIGIVTAPGGRGLVEQKLRERGATIALAEVYERAPAHLNKGHVRRLLEASGRGAVCVTSGEALDNVLGALAPDARRVLRDCVAVASSPRLEAVALAAGFRTVIPAASPAPRALLEALREHASRAAFR